jgi:hypothetical protein
MGQHVDRYAVVMVAVPAFGEFEGAPPGDHGTGCHSLPEHLPVRPGRHPVIEPVEQPPAVASEPLPGTVVRTGDEAVQGH